MATELLVSPTKHDQTAVSFVRLLIKPRAERRTKVREVPSSEQEEGTAFWFLPKLTKNYHTPTP
eukprot:scaffold21774_cov241-Amphora_coffeaeformis.AAC.2